MDVEGDADPAVGWIDATFRHRAVGLLFADLRAELADLRTMAERQASADAVADVDDLDGRLAALEDRWAALGDRLDDLARPSWHDRFDDRLTALEGALDGFEPPVDWGRVQAALDEHRAGIDGLESERQ
jgi:hypothetical protein